jgi:hypothetical protein
MKRNILCFLTLSLLIVLAACKPKYEPETASKGEIDPTRFVMIGGGHVTGYMDDGLTYKGQQNSLANIMAEQFKIVGGGEFSQAFVNQGSIGISVAGLAPFKLDYKTDCKGVSSLSPVRIATSGDASILTETLYSSGNPFGNFGIPGLKLAEVGLAGFANNNSFFKRLASSTSTSVLVDAKNANATFFSLFLGLEEVVTYAKSGGTIASLPTTSDFETQYTAVVANMTENGAKGVLATIPDVTKMPYFTTIPWNGMKLDESNVDLLNSVYNPLGYFFEIGDNGFMMVDTAANDFAVRPMESGELLSLAVPLDSVKCNQMGVLFPIRDEFILDAGEILVLRDKISAYNVIIKSIAAQYNLAVVEADKFVNKLSDGFIYNGVTMSAKFVSGGAYSLDGIHFNPKGNALLANEFIKSINSKYKSTIPLVNVGKFNATFFP